MRKYEKRQMLATILFYIFLPKCQPRMYGFVWVFFVRVQSLHLHKCKNSQNTNPKKTFVTFCEGPRGGAKDGLRRAWPNARG